MEKYSYVHNIVCANCGKSCEKRNKQKQSPKFCSRQCAGEHVKKDKNIPTYYTYSCMICGHEKTVNMENYSRKYPKYCSNKCWGARCKKTKEDKLKTFIDYYLKHVIKKDGCWEWLGGSNKKGYGISGDIKAHRISWMIHKGEIPEGMHVLHHCDNRRCTNPDHLFLGTNSDNLKDMHQKGRRYSKLTKQQVIEIKKILLENNLSYSEIGRSYGVGHKCISAIDQKKTWKHIEV